MAADIYRGFKGRLRTGVIVRSVSGALDSHGRPQGAVPIGARVEGFTENYDARYRIAAAIPITDIQVNLFSASIQGFRPGKDDKVRFDLPAANGLPARSQWYQLRTVATDPAMALWSCQGYAIDTGPQDYQVDLAALLAALADAANVGA